MALLAPVFKNLVLGGGTCFKRLWNLYETGTRVSLRGYIPLDFSLVSIHPPTCPSVCLLPSSSLSSSSIYLRTHLPICLSIFLSIFVLAAVGLPSPTLLPPWTYSVPGRMDHPFKSRAYISPFSHNLFLVRYFITAIKAWTTKSQKDTDGVSYSFSEMIFLKNWRSATRVGQKLSCAAESTKAMCGGGWVFCLETINKCYLGEPRKTVHLEPYIEERKKASI